MTSAELATIVRPPISGETVVAGVAGSPVRHTLSPRIHNAWLEAAAIDGVYIPFSPRPDGFTAFAEGLRGGAVRGLNVTAPFKEAALALADRSTDRARAAGAANLLVFEAGGGIFADNTDGEGLLGAFRAQARGFDPAAGPLVILGAGGAARGAAAAFLAAGAPYVHFIARNPDRGEGLAALFGDRAACLDQAGASESFREASAVINATPLGLGGGAGPDTPFELLAGACVVMDMVYRPVRTAWLDRAKARGLRTVDGLAMLIGQAEPSFRAFFGHQPPPIDVRSLVVAALETR